MSGAQHDALLDALALVRALHTGDDQGAEVILDHAALREVATALAGMTAYLHTEVGRLTGFGGDIPEMADELLRASLAAQQDRPEDSGTARQP